MTLSSTLVPQMEHFFAKTPDAGAGAIPREQGLETVRSNIEWLRRNSDEIKQWLDTNPAHTV